MQIGTQKDSLIRIHADNVFMNDKNRLVASNPLAEIVLPDREWSGQLARAAGSGALFSLYLSMHCQPGAEPLKLIASEENTDSSDNGLLGLNHYRRPRLNAADSDYKNAVMSSVMAHSGISAALSLWQSMHPEPLSITNNARSIPADIKANCSLATQLRLTSPPINQKQVDETGLFDVIEGSSLLLTA